MKMDTVWQAKVADSAIENRTSTLDVAGAHFSWALDLKWAFIWAGQQSQRSQKAQLTFLLLFLAAQPVAYSSLLTSQRGFLHLVS